MKFKISVMIIVLILLLNVQLSAFFVFNGSGLAFISEGKRTNAVNGSDSFNGYIVQAGSRFLKSYSDFLLLMQKIEEGEKDLEVMNKIIRSGIQELEESKTAYDNLCILADDIPYDISIIKQLKNFNYHSFFSREAGLNPVVLEQVRIFLNAGDVRGIYSKMCQEISLILEALKFLEIGINISGLPDISDLWKLNQKYSNALLFGQYAAQIFSKI